MSRSQIDTLTRSCHGAHTTRAALVRYEQRRNRSNTSTISFCYTKACWTALELYPRQPFDGMPKPISTFCNASRSHLAVTRTPHVWISEDVLSETFTAFVRNHKRFGSNVPGPLEARKRASKRRATHLAHQPATSYSPESFGLFDTRSQDGWWKKAEDPVESQPTSWQWPFMFPLVAREPPPPPKQITIEELPGGSETTYQEAKFGSIESEIHNCLRDVQTHVEAMDVLSCLPVDLRRNPHLAEVVLKQMLDQRWEYREIAEFLLDPWTNPPGTTNHLYILEHAEKHADLISWLLQESVFIRAARLGLLDVLEIQRMLHIIPKIRFPDTLGNSTWAMFCSQLLTAMDESKVLTVRDLERSFLTGWLKDIANHSFNPTVPSLLWKICQLLGLGDGEALEKVAHTSISMVEKTNIWTLSSLVDFLRSQPYHNVGPVLFSVTQTFLTEAEPEKPDQLLVSPLQRYVDKLFREHLLRQVGGAPYSMSLTLEEQEQARLVIDGTMCSQSRVEDEQTTYPSATQTLQFRIENVGKLELWYAVLGNLGSTAKFQVEMESSPLRSFLQTQLEGPEAVQRLMTAAWVAMALSAQNDSFIKLSGVSQILEAELRRNFLTATASSEDVLVKLLEAMRLLPLPAKNKLLRRIHELSGKLVTAKQNYWDLMQVLHDLDNARVLRIGDPVTYQSMKLHFPVKLTEMCEGFNEDMTRFEKSCIDIIKHVKGKIDIVCRLLDHNEKLQRSLRLAGLMTDASHRKMDRTLRSQIEVLGGRSPLELLDMVERLAHEIARSKQVSSRNAFRKVYWLKCYLVQLKIPIRTAMWKALWHARVTRLDEEGGKPCYYTVSWLYNKIVKTDGHAEADRLLHVSSTAKLMKIPGESHTTKKPYRKTQQEHNVTLGTTGFVEAAQIVQILPFSSSSLPTTIKSFKEAGKSRKADGETQQIPSKHDQDVHSAQTIKFAEIASLDAKHKPLPSNPTEQEQQTRQANNPNSIISMRSEILSRLPKTPKTERFFRPTLPEHILERRLLKVLSKPLPSNRPATRELTKGQEDEP